MRKRITFQSNIDPRPIFKKYNLQFSMHAENKVIQSQRAQINEPPIMKMFSNQRRHFNSYSPVTGSKFMMKLSRNANHIWIANKRNTNFEFAVQEYATYYSFVVHFRNWRHTSMQFSFSIVRSLVQDFFIVVYHHTIFVEFEGAKWLNCKIWS